MTIQVFRLSGDGRTPNHPRYPLIVAKAFFANAVGDAQARILLLLLVH